MLPRIELTPVSTAAQVANVARMAHEVWNEYYVPLIGQAQVDYMVAKFQSAESAKWKAVIGKAGIEAE